MIGVFAGVLALGRWVASASLASTVVLVVLGVLARCRGASRVVVDDGDGRRRSRWSSRPDTWPASVHGCVREGTGGPVERARSGACPHPSAPTSHAPQAGQRHRGCRSGSIASSVCRVARLTLRSPPGSVPCSASTTGAARGGPMSPRELPQQRSEVRGAGSPILRTRCRRSRMRIRRSARALTRNARLADDIVRHPVRRSSRRRCRCGARGFTCHGGPSWLSSSSCSSPRWCLPSGWLGPSSRRCRSR